MPNKSPTRMNYLTTDYLQPPRSARKRLTRSVSPSPRGSVSFEDGTVPGMLPELRKAVSAKSLHMFDGNSSSDSSPNSSLKLHKSTESLCFGMTKKRFHRRTHVLSDGEFRVRSNTDPISKFPKRREWKLPIISIPERDVYTITPATPTAAAPRRRSVVEAGGALGSLIQQTLKVTTASMGLKSTDKKDRLTQAAPRSTHEDVKSKFSRSTSSVSALGYNTTATTTQADDSTSMAPLQCHINDDDAQSVTTTTTATTALENIAADKTLQQQQQQQSQKKRIFYQQLSTSGGSTQSGYSSANSSFNESYQNLTTLERNQKQENRSLKAQSSGSLNPLASVASSASLRSLSPSRKSVSSNGSNTAKHEQQSTAAATAAATSNAANATAAVVASEKEKKRKEMSSSRVKKFQRHFTQVSKDEKLINYFSCALVSDILLQGHLYITDQHFAFYSNVFGYVTKVVIPTSAVTKISKEKTAKIIPNAVGVATADERHVFGSFISREAAFRLMCSVCPPLAPAEILPKAPTDVETFEEYSIEDDSSCSISGNESPPQLLDGSAAAASAGGGVTVTDGGQTLLRRTTASSSLNIADSKRPINEKQQRHSDIPANAKNSLITNSTSNQSSHSQFNSHSPSSTQYANTNNSKSNISPMNHLNANANNNNNKTNFTHDSKMNGTSENSSIGSNNLTMIIGGTASSATSTTSASATSTPSTTSSSPATTVMASTPPKSVAQAAADNLRSLSKQAMMRLKFPTELNVVYVGMLLTFVLGLFSVFLLFRILSIEAKTSLYHSPVDFNWRSGNDDDIFAEALRWQKELQTKSTEEAQTILNTNLEQIAKVRRSLETLSMLIHDRSSAYGNAQRDDSD